MRIHRRPVILKTFVVLSFFPFFFSLGSFLNQVAEEIWVVDEGRVAPWGGDILTYKASLKKKKKSMS